MPKCSNHSGNSNFWRRHQEIAIQSKPVLQFNILLRKPILVFLSHVCLGKEKTHRHQLIVHYHLL